MKLSKREIFNVLSKIIGLIIGISSVIYLIYLAGWKITGCILIMIWANNYQRDIFKKNPFEGYPKFPRKEN